MKTSYWPVSSFTCVEPWIPPTFSLQHPPFPCVLLSCVVSPSPPLRVHLITHFLYRCLSQAPVLWLEKVDWSHYTSEIVFVLVFIVVKNTKHDIYLLNRFLGIQYGIVNHRYNIVQHIPRTHSFCITETLYLLNSNSPFHPTPDPST